MKGLTLVEVLIAMGIAVIVGGLLMVIIVNSAGLTTKESSKISQGLSINDALSEIRKSIKNASTIANQYTDGSTIYTTGTNQLVLKVASVDGLGNILDNTYDYFIFYTEQTDPDPASGKKLHFKIYKDPLSSRQATNRIFSTSTDSLTFQYFNSANPGEEVPPEDAVKIRTTLILKEQAGLNYETNIATSEASLRND